MNFLAHIYLSGSDDLIRIGNFMADDIKGQRYKNYPKPVQIGILLHRQIDTYTDAHAVVRQSTRRLHGAYSHYSGVIVDILYDHFLAKHWARYSSVPLAVYTSQFYKSLTPHHDLLSKKLQKMIPVMIADDWLLSYASINGIAKVLEGMNRRTNNSGIDKAIHEFQVFYTLFEAEFLVFFEALMGFSKTTLARLCNTML